MKIVMKKIIFVFMASAFLLACTNTWEGVKEDSKEVTRSVGDASNELADKIKDSLSSEDKKGEE